MGRGSKRLISLSPSPPTRYGFAHWRPLHPNIYNVSVYNQVAVCSALQLPAGRLTFPSAGRHLCVLWGCHMPGHLSLQSPLRRSPFHFLSLIFVF
ncbi:hypothetical protein GDO81_022121 [Engystomops pustulosus]|uniref:Uncharacterized protein n=1 Tax=Engystomops pustulosus TaxID=76066 RepID=A0AAV6YNL9_ENGPU|nr:hypothetical protein GDO81_022121 [Engystomops pustulosus]